MIGADYRNNLAKEIKSAPKEMRRDLLNKESQSAEYINAYVEYYKSRWQERDLAERQLKEAKKPNLDFNFNNQKEFEKNIYILADFIYSTTMYGIGQYEPYRGHALCGPITDKFIDYLKSKSIKSRRVNRWYEARRPDGSYDSSFGHVYLTIDLAESKEHILIDPTYLQWVSPEERNKLPPVLIIRYKDMHDFREEFKKTPIKNDMAIPLYLGFNSPEAKEYFKDTKHTIVSENILRIEE